MKWLVMALSTVTVTIWGIVLFFYLDIGQTAYVYADQHEVVQHKHDYKQTNFIFRTKKMPDNTDTGAEGQESSNSETESEQSQQAPKSLANLTLELNDDNTVSIDEIMSKLDIEVE
ncbi:hypothetical protein [Gracilibacillus thailandensis]|uniref:Uncharacterized protein n=1 Tax=Gracilibacillus thailandensis TaxID=563735 RepID=A0A6N7QZ80_9BACI|nr:hypothetical protein [Gracilibacillus thailandensis]MRI65219.1 hypothetical protein [Gracilibacillus thailandensis]